MTPAQFEATQNLGETPPKISVRSNPDGTSATFRIFDEDHTLGNPIRYLLSKRNDVELSGYTQPHPLENFINVRVQMKQGTGTAEDAMVTSLEQISSICDRIGEQYSEAVKDAKGSGR